MSRLDSHSDGRPVRVASYDGFADWYDAHLTSFAGRATPLLSAFLDGGSGRCLEVGCGGGVQTGAIAAAGWSVVGLDLSADQLRVARQRAPTARLVQGDAIRLPFPDASFDAVAATFIHTDVDDWGAVVAEAARVLRAGGHLTYIGTHPCFVGPFSRYPGADPPRLYAGYRSTERTTIGPGIGEGLRRRVGVRHVPLASFLRALLAAGLRLERIEEPGPEDYPRLIAVQARREGTHG